MKKIFITMMAFGALTLTSCNNSTKKATDNVDTTQVSNVEAASADELISTLQEQLQSKDANALQATLATIQTKYAELLQSGKLEEAKAYLAKAQSFIKEHAEQITAVTGRNATITNLLNNIQNIPTSTEEVVDKVKESLQGNVDETKKAATDKVNEAAAKVNEKAADAAAKVNDAANKVNDAAAKVNEKANNAAKAIKGLGL